jgi:hypothetical protein
MKQEMPIFSMYAIFFPEKEMMNKRYKLVCIFKGIKIFRYMDDFLIEILLLFKFFIICVKKVTTFFMSIWLFL